MKLLKNLIQIVEKMRERRQGKGDTRLNVIKQWAKALNVTEGTPTDSPFY